jgi:hypothetical protein
LRETSNQSVLCTNIKPLRHEPEADTKRNILRTEVERIAIHKYRSGGYGLTFLDVQREFSVGKKRAQRCLKHLHGKKVLFTPMDLTRQGIRLLENKSPQQYFPVRIKAEIIENLKRRNIVHDDPEFQPLTTSFPFRNSNLLQKRKAQTFLDVLLLLPFTPIYIHKLQLKFSIDKRQIGNDKRIGSHEEIIGRRYVRYTLSANGTVQIAIRSNETPFRLETDPDISIIFSFFGQVKDRLLCLLKDVKELIIPPVTAWTLIQCDVNKDVEIDEKCQLTLPDIQLKYMDRVFREYVKIKHDKAYCRVEESVKLNKLLPEALDNIRRSFQPLERRIDNLAGKIDQLNSQVTEGLAAIAGKEGENNGGSS